MWQANPLPELPGARARAPLPSLPLLRDMQGVFSLQLPAPPAPAGIHHRPAGPCWAPRRLCSRSCTIFMMVQEAGASLGSELAPPGLEERSQLYPSEEGPCTVPMRL